MTDKIFSSPKLSPDFVLHRHLEGAADSAPASYAIKTHGMNMSGFEWANLQIVPSAGSNPVVTIYFWSEEAAKFVAEDNALYPFAAKGNGVAWSASVDARGRVMFVSVTGGVGIGEECKVLVAGYRSRQS